VQDKEPAAAGRQVREIPAAEVEEEAA